jgi:L-amino acid N-acyltransferase YncA
LGETASTFLWNPMTLAEFRKRYPQYNDVPDGELAERLHRKYYFEMSFAEFARRIGYTSPVFGPIYVQERRSRAGFGLALPCSLLLYARCNRSRKTRRSSSRPLTCCGRPW